MNTWAAKPKRKRGIALTPEGTQETILTPEGTQEACTTLTTPGTPPKRPNTQAMDRAPDQPKRDRGPAALGEAKNAT